jgi:S-phase kinase-associated protein 1
MADNRTVHLVSNEGESFDVPLSAAKMSELVKTMLDEEAEDADDIQEIPLPNVKSTVLALVIEFLRHQTVEPMNDIEKVREETDSENEFPRTYFF